MSKSRSIGRTRRLHYTWLERGLFGSRRWRSACRCGWSGGLRRYEARAWADGAAHAASRNERSRRSRMRTMVAAVAAVAVLTVAGAAVAEKNPGPDVVTGTAGDDYLVGGRSPDVIHGLGGADDIWGQRAPDLLYGGAGDDRLHGFGSGEASDLLDGGPGWDVCVATRNDVLVSCEVVRVRKGLGQR